LRIIGGEARGAKIEAPRGKIARPMRDQVRQALFDILGPIEGLRVVDLFAGSGSLGLEAISRGAARGVFVEIAAPCLDAIAKNVAHLGFEDRATIRRADISRGLQGLVGAGLAPFDLVLMDPPFDLLRRPPARGEPDVRALLRELATTPGLLAPGARIVLETPVETFRIESELPRLSLRLLLRREYGSTALVILTPDQTGAGPGP
jgi:16S rRNA (guanine966-N2)-methyltransferase